MKLLLILGLVLFFITPIYAEEEEEAPVKYELKIQMKFNAIPFERALEIQRALQALADETCTTEMFIRKRGSGNTTLSITHEGNLFYIDD